MMMSEMWSTVLHGRTGELAYCSSADDVIFKTFGWDILVERAFADCPDKILYCHGDDLSGNGHYYGTHGIIHRKWFQTIGYFTGPGFSADFADYWVTQIAEFIGRRRFLPFVCSHEHHAFGKTMIDDTYRETLERLHRDNTPKLYAERLPERMRDALKLIEAMK